MNPAELQRELERVEGQLFWLDDRFYGIVPEHRLGDIDAIKHDGVPFVFLIMKGDGLRRECSEMEQKLSGGVERSMKLFYFAA